jgi:hypothetical protein
MPPILQKAERDKRTDAGTEKTGGKSLKTSFIEEEEEDTYKQEAPEEIRHCASRLGKRIEAFTMQKGISAIDPFARFSDWSLFPLQEGVSRSWRTLASTFQVDGTASGQEDGFDDRCFLVHVVRCSLPSKSHRY